METNLEDAIDDRFKHSLEFLENLRNLQKHFAEIYKREPMSNAGE